MSRSGSLVGWAAMLMVACGHDNWVEPAGHGTLAVISFEGGPLDKDAPQLKSHLERKGFPLLVGETSLGVGDVLVPTEQLSPALEEARKFISSSKLTVRLAHHSDPGWFVVFDGGVAIEEQTYLVPAQTRPASR